MTYHSDASSALADQRHSNLKLSTHMSAASLLSLERSSDFPSYGTSSKVSSQPVLEQSSCSDFSYSVGEDVVDEEECEEWAKLILADVSIEEKTHVPPEKTRVCSGNDYESLGSSPAGFWHHHPVDSSVPKSNVDWDTPPSSPSKKFQRHKPQLRLIAELRWEALISGGLVGTQMELLFLVNRRG